MNQLEQQVQALMRLCTAQQEEDRQKARGEVLEFLQAVPATPDPEAVTRDILLELGAPENLLGHPYMVEAILLVVEDRTYIDNIMFGLYPQVAARFDTTAARVERALRHLIEVIFSRCDWSILLKYFGNTIDPDKGKPTNSEFVARIANVVKLRLKAAA